jgi:hypothetical protein
MGAAWKIVVLRECAGAQASIRLARWLVGWLAGWLSFSSAKHNITRGWLQPWRTGVQ